MIRLISHEVLPAPDHFKHSFSRGESLDEVLA